MTASGDSIGGSHAWYVVTFVNPSGTCALQVRLSGGTGDAFDVTDSFGNASITGNTSVGLTDTGTTTYYFDVYGGNTAAAFALTMSIGTV